MSEQLHILEMIEKGELSIEEGEQRLKTLSSTAASNHSLHENLSTIEILELIENGEMSSDEGLEKMLHATPTSEVENVNEEDHQTQDYDLFSEDSFKKWQAWWTIPAVSGFVITFLSAIWMNSVYENSGTTFWFFFAWLPLFLGLLIMGIAWPSKNKPWVHVRIQQPPGEKPERIAISIPLPTWLVAGGLKMATYFSKNDSVSKLDSHTIEQLFSSFRKSAEEGKPFYADIDEGKNGAKVKVFIG